MELTLLEQVQVLRLVRERYQASSQALKDSEAAWRASIVSLIDRAKADALALGNAETVVRAAVLEAYHATGDRKPAPGVEVKDYRVLRYELDKALVWAKEHGLALALDKKAFEAIAKAGGAGGVATVEVLPQVNIATDLAKALAGAAPEQEVIAAIKKAKEQK